MTVYRLEHKTTHRGVYHNTPLYNKIYAECCVDREHAWHGSNYDAMHSDGCSSATKSIEQLLEWFDRGYEILEREGYVIGVYDAPDITDCDPHQLLFKRETALRVDEIELSKCLELQAA